MLATGARARVLPGLEPDGKLIWTYREAMVPDSLPKSMLVVGSGAIGIEFASFYNDLGVEVTVVEVVDRILSAEDEEISALAHKAFVKAGIKIITSAKVTGVKKATDRLTATDRNSRWQVADLTVDRSDLRCWHRRQCRRHRPRRHEGCSRPHAISTTDALRPDRRAGCVGHR